MKILLLFIYVFSFATNQTIIKNLHSNSNKFSFVVMGDNRDGDYVLKQIIKQTNQDKSIKFLIDNGDLVSDGYQTQFNNYLKIIQTSNKPIISVIGNHEIPWYDGESNYKNFFGKTYFSFKYSNSYFIILDTSNKKLSKKQIKWLKKKLKYSKKYTNCFVFMHVPLYDPRKGKYKKGHSFKNLKQAKKLNKLLDKYNVTMFFASHIHSYFRGFWHKTPYIITGGAGAPLKRNGFYHYIKVMVNCNNVKFVVIKLKEKNDSNFI